MIPLSLFLVLLAGTGARVELVDDSYDIPAGDWRYVELTLKQLPVTVLCDYTVEAGSDHVRLALLRRADLERMRRDLTHGVVAITEPGGRGHLQYHLRNPGDYVVMVDNRLQSHKASHVHLRVVLDFVGSGSSGPAITYVPKERRLVVILVSFAVFFGIVTWSAKKLLHAVRN